MIRGLVASIIRFDSFFHGNAIADGSWTVQLPIWTMVEPNIYLIAACLVTYHPLLKRLRKLTGRIKSSALSRSGKSSTTPNALAPSLHIGPAREPLSARVFPGRRKAGKHDLESLGNTFDMNDTVDVGDGDSVGTGDNIRLVHLGQSKPEGVKETDSTRNE